MSKDSRPRFGRVEYSSGPDGLSVRSLEDTLREARQRAKRRPTVAEYRRRADKADEAFHRSLEHEERRRRVPLLQKVQATDRLRGVCVHEAGHAVLGVIEGAGVDRIELDLRKAFGGSEVNGGRYIPRRHGALSAKVLLAGQEAAFMAGVWVPETWSGSDERQAEATGEDLGLARVEARRLLSRYWGAVEAVASELQRFGYVDGRTAEALIFASGVPA